MELTANVELYDKATSHINGAWGISTSALASMFDVSTVQAVYMSVREPPPDTILRSNRVLEAL